MVAEALPLLHRLHLTLVVLKVAAHLLLPLPQHLLLHRLLRAVATTTPPTRLLRAVATPPMKRVLLL